jgi:hypothetical protein
MIKVGFDKELHKYFNLETGELLISATTLIHHHYTPPFDGAFWSFYKAIERVLGTDEFKPYKRVLNGNKDINFATYYFRNHPKLDDFLSVQQTILGEWQKTNLDACEKGTAFHDAQEAAAIGAKTTTHPDCEEILNVFAFGMHLDLEDLPIGYYPELRLYNLDYGVAGTSDCIWILPGKQVYVSDYKTNKQLKFENKYQKMLYPLNHLDDCNFNHYQIQLSLYGYMLECMGYIIKGMEIIYEGEAIPFEYRREDVITMLNHYQANKEPIHVEDHSL